MNVRNSDGASALIAASQHGYLETVKLLLGESAEINAQDCKGMTPLMHASLKGHLTRTLEYKRFILYYKVETSTNMNQSI